MLNSPIVSHQEWDAAWQIAPHLLTDAMAQSGGMAKIEPGVRGDA
jgi:hypothetical protein